MKNIELKPLVRARDKYLCCFCKKNIFEVKDKEGRGGQCSVHHILPIRLGGQNIPENTITICSNCHKLLEILIKVVEDQYTQHRLTALNFQYKVPNIIKELGENSNTN